MIRKIKLMRANLVWFIPLVVQAIYISFQNIISGYENIALLIHRFSWGAYFLVTLSPSTYVFFSALGTAIQVPLFVLIIPNFFDQGRIDLYRHRYLFSIGLVLSIVAIGFLLEVVIWGSFPLDVGKDGYIHIRLIPFIPWPETPLFG